MLAARALGLIIASTDDGWCGNIVLAEVVEGSEVGGIEVDRAGEAGLNLAGEGEPSDGAGVAGLHAVGAAEPEVIVAVLDCWRAEAASSHWWMASSA